MKIRVKIKDTYNGIDIKHGEVEVDLDDKNISIDKSTTIDPSMYDIIKSIISIIKNN